MKKTLIALAALAATGAFAQSSVTIYGRMDIGYSNNVTTYEGGAANATGLAIGAARLSGTATTAAATAAAPVTAAFPAGANTAELRDHGINNAGLASNLWGLKGSEDLGGGMKANFQLEQSMAIDTGAATGFTRVSTLGLSGNFGEVKMGRDYTPLFSTIGASDVFGTTGATTVNLYPDAVRASDMISYSTPALGGFNAKVMLGRNDTGTTAAAATSANTGLSVGYAAGPLMVGFAYGKIESTVGATNAQNVGSALSATYNLGVAKLFGGYTRSKAEDNTAVATYVEGTETNLGVSVPMGAATFMLGYGRNTANFTNAGVETASLNGNDLVVGVSYSLSKRTSMYAKTGSYNKVDGTVAGVAVSQKTNTTALGLLHTF